MRWQVTAAILCAYGLFKEFRPSEPFVTTFLTDEKNITMDEVIHVAFPVSTYANLVTLVLVFIITDFVRYRLIIIFGGLAYVGCWSLLIWGEGLESLIIVEALYGLAYSTEVAYYTYIYTTVSKEDFKKVTSYTHVAILVGRFFSGLVAQILRTFLSASYMFLTYLSLGSVSIAFVFSIFLPKVNQSIYFYPDGAVADLSLKQRAAKAYPVLWADFKTAYSNRYALKWCFWWAVASSGYSLVLNYVQAVWEAILDSHTNVIYNGYVDAIHTLLSALLAAMIGYTKINWKKWGEIMLFVTACLQGGMLLAIATATNIYVAYAGYIVFRLLFQVIITVAMAEVAQNITEDSYGLVIGVNSFLALVLQSIFTFIITDSRGLALEVKTQFLVYGSGFVALGVAFGVMVIWKILQGKCSSETVVQREQKYTNGPETEESRTAQALADTDTMLETRLHNP